MIGPDPADLARAIEQIRPRVRGHAGDITVHVDHGVAAVHFEGACESCPAMAVTYAGLVRSTLLEVDGISAVEAPQVHASPRALNRIAVALGATVVDG
jgi:Fe-S cluster biogenesis protein NfuA